MPIEDLYDDIIKPPSLGGLAEAIDKDENYIISDSKLHGCFLPQEQLMPSRIRDSCGR